VGRVSGRKRSRSSSNGRSSRSSEDGSSHGLEEEENADDQALRKAAMQVAKSVVAAKEKAVSHGKQLPQQQQQQQPQQQPNYAATESETTTQQLSLHSDTLPSPPPLHVLHPTTVARSALPASPQTAGLGPAPLSHDLPAPFPQTYHPTQQLTSESLQREGGTRANEEDDMHQMAARYVSVLTSDTAWLQASCMRLSVY